VEKDMRILDQYWERLNLKKQNMKKDMAGPEVATKLPNEYIYTQKASFYRLRKPVPSSHSMIFYTFLIIYKLLYIPLCSTSLHLS